MEDKSEPCYILSIPYLHSFSRSRLSSQGGIYVLHAEDLRRGVWKFLAYSGVRSFTFTSAGASRKSTCCQFNLFLESYLWRGKAKFGIICDLGVTFNNDWRIFGVRFTRIPPWLSSTLRNPKYCSFASVVPVSIELPRILQNLLGNLLIDIAIFALLPLVSYKELICI